jgi:hypothetical protein
MGAELDGRDGGPESLGGLGDGETFSLDELEGDALILRKLLELAFDRGRELFCADDVVGRRVERDEQLCGVVVRAREDLAASATILIDEESTRDGERPRYDLRAGNEATSCAMDPKHRLLQNVFGALAVARRPDEEAHEPRREAIVDLAEGRIVAARVAVHRSIQERALFVSAAWAHLHRAGSITLAVDQDAQGDADHGTSRKRQHGRSSFYVARAAWFRLGHAATT